MAIEKQYGIDVSYYQGVIDWEAVKATGINWCILRGGFGNSAVDTQFINNITGAAAAGIENIGVYWFSYAHDVDTATTEVAFCLQTLEPYREFINMPVWFDWEEASYSYAQRTYGIDLTGADIRKFARTWCNEIVAAGYQVGIYSNKSNGEGWFKNTNGSYLWEELNCDFWYARYGANNERELFIVPAFEATALEEHPETNILQYSDVGIVSGINSQRVDLNIKYVEIPEPPTPPEPEPVPIEPDTKTAIEYLKIGALNADKTAIEQIGIIDNALSIIWHSVYFSVGDFEIYMQFSSNVFELLSIGNFVTRPNNNEIGIIEKIEIKENKYAGKIIIATGRFAKSILDRRQIYKMNDSSTNTQNTPTILNGSVAACARTLVEWNATNAGTNYHRNIPVLTINPQPNYPDLVVDENGNQAKKQVSYANLLEYSDEFLKEYNLAATIKLTEAGKLEYNVLKGTDRSATNEEGNEPVIFGVEYDNLSNSTYSYDITALKGNAIIGGAGQDLERFYYVLIDGESGLDRRETFIDASSLNRTYKDEHDAEQTYSFSEYRDMLVTYARQRLKELTAVETYDGTIDILNSNFVFNKDFSLGDIVTIQDNEINKYVNVRISELTEVQDENGYKIDAKYTNL